MNYFSYQECSMHVHVHIHLCMKQRQSSVARQKLMHAYYAFASYERREGHLYKGFLVLAKTRLI